MYRGGQLVKSNNLRSSKNLFSLNNTGMATVSMESIIDTNNCILKPIAASNICKIIIENVAYVLHYELEDTIKEE